MNPDLITQSDLGVRDTDVAEAALSWTIEPIGPLPGGPDRATIWVPTEETIVNLGAAFPGPTAAFAGPPALDHGIAGRTRTHVHFHAMGGPDGEQDPTRTLVRAGVPAGITISGKSPEEARIEAEMATLIPANISINLAQLFAEAWSTVAQYISPASLPTTINFNQEARWNELSEQLRVARNHRADSSNSIGTVFPEPHTIWHGYSMITRGGAVHESLLNQIMVSGEGDLRLAGQRSVSIGSPGDVLIAVNADGNIAEFCHNQDGDQTNPALPGPGKLHRETADNINAVNTTVAAAISLSYSVMSILQGYNKSPLYAGQGGRANGRSGWDGSGPGDYIPTALSMLAAGGGVAVTLSAPLRDTPGGRLDLFSSSTVNIVGGNSATLHGVWYTSVGAAGAVSVSGAQLLSLSSNAIGLFSAPIISVSAVTKMSFECMMGPFAVHARSTIELASQRNVVVGANKSIQLASMDGQVTVFGRAGFLLSAGGGARRAPPTRFASVFYEPDSGHGVHGDKTHVRMCKLRAANVAFEDPQLVADKYIEINDDRIKMKFGEAELKIEEQKFELRVEKFRVNASGEYTINGSTIKLG